MEKFLVSLFAIIGVIFVLVPIVTLISGISAWIVGQFFGDMISETFKILFNTTLDLSSIGFFKIGITLGFLGSFVRAINTK